MRTALRRRVHRVSAPVVLRTHVDPRTLCIVQTCGRKATSGVNGWQLCKQCRAERGSLSVRTALVLFGASAVVSAVALFGMGGNAPAPAPVNLSARCVAAADKWGVAVDVCGDRTLGLRAERVHGVECLVSTAPDKGAVGGQSSVRFCADGTVGRP